MLIVNIAVLSLVIVPCYIIVYIGHKQYNKIGKRFQEEVKIHSLQIDEYERWNRNALGIDFKQQKLLFVTIQNEALTVKMYPLENIKESKIIPYFHTVKTGGKVSQKMDKLFLELTPYDEIDKVLISLYDSNHTYEEEYEMKHAEKWNKLINNAVIKTQRKQKAA